MKVSAIVYIVMGLMAIMLGGIVIMIPSFLGPLDPGMRYFFAIMLLAYGAFRIFTGLSQMKKRDRYQI